MNPNNSSPSLLETWTLAIRPKTLPAAISPVLIGLGIAINESQFNFLAALAAMFAALMIQIGTNLVNDVMDYHKGADTEERLGPIRVTQTGLLTSRQVWGGVGLSFGLAILAGIYLIYVAGWPVLVIGTASLLAGFAYTAGPYPLAYIGLADLFVMLFFGFAAVCGTVFVTSGTVPASAWWGAIAAGALTINILVVNNIRDIEADRKAGRKNLPVVFGRKAAEGEYILMLLLAYSVPIIFFTLFSASPWIFLPFLTIPRAFIIAKMISSGLSGPALNPILGKTAQLLFQYSLLFSISLWIGSIFS